MTDVLGRDRLQEIEIVEALMILGLDNFLESSKPILLMYDTIQCIIRLKRETI